MSAGTVEEQVAKFFSWQESSHHEAIQCLQSGDGSGALTKLEEVFRQCGRLEATPHYLIYEAALQVLEAECPSPEYRPNVVLEIHDRTVPSLSVLARQYCYVRTSRALRDLSSPSDLQYEAVPYAITARDWRDGFSGKAGAAVPEIADEIGGVEGGQLDRLLRTAQLKMECEQGEGESRELGDLKANDVLEALSEASQIHAQFSSGEIPSITHLLFGPHEGPERELQPAAFQGSRLQSPRSTPGPVASDSKNRRAKEGPERSKEG
jgi:hypothetical protein